MKSKFLSTPGDSRVGHHQGLLVQEDETLLVFYFVHQMKNNSPTRRTWLQVAKLGFEGQTLTCDRDADFVLLPPNLELMPEHMPIISPVRERIADEAAK